MLEGRFRSWLALPLATLLLNACAGEHRDWAFVQGVGGMSQGAMGSWYAEPDGASIDLGEIFVVP